MTLCVSFFVCKLLPYAKVVAFACPTFSSSFSYFLLFLFLFLALYLPWAISSFSQFVTKSVQALELISEYYTGIMHVIWISVSQGHLSSVCPRLNVSSLLYHSLYAPTSSPSADCDEKDVTERTQAGDIRRYDSSPWHAGCTTEVITTQPYLQSTWVGWMILDDFQIYISKLLTSHFHHSFTHPQMKS